jgi:uncharacterized membrane protein
MNDVPLHPAIVHIPLGLAVVIPLVALVMVWAVYRGKLPSRAFALVLGLQAIVVGAGFVAMNTGEADEERVERVVPESAIEEHEEAGELFVWVSVVTLVLAGLATFTRKRASTSLMLATATAGILAAGLGLRAGHEGGELVYVHGAASAHTQAGSSARAGPAESHGDEGDDDDDDDDDD